MSEEDKDRECRALCLRIVGMCNVHRDDPATVVSALCGALLSVALSSGLTVDDLTEGLRLLADSAMARMPS